MNKKTVKLNSTSKPAIFLDRDGTINYDYGYVHKFADLKFRPKILKGMRYLTKKKYLIFIVTNQAGIAKGKFKLSDLITLHKQMKAYLKKRKIYVNDIEYCPYHPYGIIKRYKKKSGFRKPGNLMIKKILKKWDINLKKSFMLGDQKSDALAAKKSGLYFEYVGFNFYKQIRKIEKKITNNY